MFTDFYHMKLSFQGYYTNPQSHPNEAHLPLSQVWSLCKFQAAGIGSGLMGSHVHVCLCRLFLLYKVAVKSSKKGVTSPAANNIAVGMCSKTKESFLNKSSYIGD